MGEAKRRGSYEERKAQAIIRKRKEELEFEALLQESNAQRKKVITRNTAGLLTLLGLFFVGTEGPHEKGLGQ